MNISETKDDLTQKGYSIIESVFTNEEINNLISLIENTDTSKETFRKSDDLFAIRQFLKEIPEAVNLIFNQNIQKIIQDVFGENYFVVKSIYFDKPEKSNWYVPYHQDLTISVDKKKEMKGFNFWTTKQNQFSVQPPLEILENIYTIRIHLDDTDEKNGALKIIPNSHSKKIYRPETIDWNTETEEFCTIKKGGIMIMKPLLLHGSNRTIDNRKRRVIHIEFSDIELPEKLNWSEKLN